MLFLVGLACFCFAQVSLAQVLNIPNGQIAQGNLLQRNVNLPNNGFVANGFNGITGNARNLPNTGVITSNVANLGNNLVATNLVGGNGIVTNNFGNNVVTGSLASNNGIVGRNLLSNNFASGFGGNAIGGTNYLGKNVGLGNYVTANTPVNLANGFNINSGTFSLSNNGLAAYLPPGLPCGIQILADALEVGGAVGVNGKLPFYTNVNVNGNLPSSGSGYVSCACNGQ